MPAVTANPLTLPRIHAATALLQSLGNQSAAGNGIVLLNESASRQRGLAYGLIAAGLATLLFNLLRRALTQFQPNRYEVDL